MSNKTYVACRPGMHTQMKAAFDGMEVVVDDTLIGRDYEFRERALTLEEIMEEEVEKEEKAQADPKNALTVVVPLDPTGDLEGASFLPYLAVRVDSKGASRVDLNREVGNVKITLDTDGEVNVSATIGALTSHLKKEGFNVLSISQSSGLVWMKV